MVGKFTFHLKAINRLKELLFTAALGVGHGGQSICLVYNLLSI